MIIYTDKSNLGVKELVVALDSKLQCITVRKSKQQELEAIDLMHSQEGREVGRGGEGRGEERDRERQRQRECLHVCVQLTFSILLFACFWFWKQDFSVS